MEPIISPWFIYFLGIVDGIGIVIGLTAIVVGILILVFCIMEAVPWDFSNGKEDFVKMWYSKRKWMVPFFIITLIACIVIPSKNTLIGMYVTKNITYDRAEKILDAGKSVKEELKNDVFELIEALKDDKESKGK